VLDGRDLLVGPGGSWYGLLMSKPIVFISHITRKAKSPSSSRTHGGILLNIIYVFVLLIQEVPAGVKLARIR